MSKIFNKEKTTREVNVARTRGNLYLFLTSLYAGELDLRLLRQIRGPDFIQALSGLGIEFEKDFLEGSEKELLDEMNIEHTRLFINPGRHISPHESVHRSGEGLLWGNSTVRVKAFIQSSGLKYRSDFKGIPDHISVELEFMYRLVEAEIEAREKGDPVKLDKIHGLQRRFFDEHISKWIPRFTERIAKETKLDFYRKIAQLTKEFILFEKRCYEKE